MSILYFLLQAKVERQKGLKNGWAALPILSYIKRVDEKGCYVNN